VFFVVLDSRANTYYNQKTDSWVKHIVCATFFDYQTQADEVCRNSGMFSVVTLRETEDLSKYKVDVAIEKLFKI